MLEINVGYHGKEAALQGALLIYAGRTNYESSALTTYATVHKAQEIKGSMEIMPGRLLTQNDLADLTLALSETEVSRTNEVQWFEESVIAKGKDRIIWWTPPGEKSMFFEESDLAEMPVKGNGVCPTPGLVWVAMPGQSLYVYAVKGRSRPTKEMQLHQAPFFNVWSRGAVCLGSAVMPSENKTWETEAWEHMFFGSRFTHANFREKNRLVKGIDPSLFWRNMLAQPPRSFPEKRLVSIPLTVGDLLDPLLTDKLNKLPRAEGEF